MGSKIQNKNELRCPAVPWARPVSSEGREVFVSGGSWPWMTSSSSLLTVLLPSLTCLAVRHRGCTSLCGAPCPPKAWGVCRVMVHVSAIPKSSTDVRHWLRSRKKDRLLQNNAANRLLLCASVFPGFAYLSSLFSLSPYIFVQCQVQKVPDFASSSEVFP